jgi:ABC-2 type transport system ATP-binding protein
MTDGVIEMKGLTRWFGTRCVCRDVSLSVPRGSVFALVGRNGAGKSTSIRMLLGLLQPSRGRSMLLGHDSQDLPPEVRARVGYLAENHPVYPRMTVGEHARFQARYYPRWKAGLFDETCETFQIDSKTKAEHLSRGQRAGMCLGLTLATDPEVLVLDDPSLGLDPVARRQFLEAIVTFTRAEGRTVLFSTHLLTDVERVADTIAVLDEGVLRACCSIETFLGHVRQYAVRYEVKPPAIPPFPGLLSVKTLEHELRVTAVSEDTPTALRALPEIERLDLSLEDSLLAYISQRRSQRLGLGGQQP